MYSSKADFLCFSWAGSTGTDFLPLRFRTWGLGSGRTWGVTSLLPLDAGHGGQSLQKLFGIFGDDYFPEFFRYFFFDPLWSFFNLLLRKLPPEWVFSSPVTIWMALVCSVGGQNWLRESRAFLKLFFHPILEDEAIFYSNIIISSGWYGPIPSFSFVSRLLKWHR